MKLLREFVDFKDLNIFTEDSEPSAKKHIKLKGIFLEADVKNKNERIYPKPILESEVTRYQDVIKTGRAVGELSHPETPEINLDRIALVIESLAMKDNQGIGCCRLIDTPLGLVAQTLVSEKILLGISTRGVGELKEGIVQPGYQLICADLVWEPSCTKAILEAVTESKNWKLENDKWISEEVNKEQTKILEVATKELKEDIDKKYKTNDVNSQQVLRYLLSDFLKKIKE